MGKHMKWRSTAIAFFILLLAGCTRGSSETAPEQVKTTPARVETLQPVNLPVYAVLPGTVVSADRVDVSSRLSGYIYDLNVHEGQTVKKDQLLFAVDPTGIKEQIRQATAELAKASAALAESKDNYQRFKNLYQDHSATLADYQQAERMYKVALGNQQAAESVVAAAKSQLKYAEIRSPFDGLVVSKLANNGQLSSPGMPVLVLENPTRLQVQVQVDEQAFTHLALGQNIKIELAGENLTSRVLTGEVERMVAAADPVTHTHLVKLGLPAGSMASSGNFVLVSVPVGDHEGIVVPQEAIYKRAGLTGVFVVDANGLARFRMVTPGETMDQGRTILSGLSAGDRLIVSARNPLYNGIKIQPEAENRP